MRRFLLLLTLGCALLAGCGQSISEAPGGASGAGAGAVTPVFAFSEAVVGPNRLPIGLIRNNSPLNDPAAKVHLRFYDLNDTSAQVKSEADATYYGQGLPAAVYVAYATFDRPGDWGVEVQVQLAGQRAPTSSRLRLNVLPRSSVPNVGEKAIPVKTLTVRDVPDPSRLSSASPVNPALYQISLDEALRSGKPTALLFATPAFCRTATCGPSLEVLGQLQQRFGDRVNFIHVEVYRYPFAESFERINQAAQAATKAGRELSADELRASFSDPMVAWRLTTEPWLYLIGADGTIVGRYEGGITAEELAPVFEKLAAGQ